MKIIDEKGRLFGKINLIDFMVIVFFLCLTPMFWFGYKIFTKAPTLPSAKFYSISKEEYKALQEKSQVYEELQKQVNTLLQEHKRLEKYFK